MKRYFERLGTVLLTGALALGMGVTAGAQQGPPASQQPMEIPIQAQYPPQYPPQAYPGGPGAPPQQGGPQQQPGAQQQQQNDPGAGRVSFVHGDVSTQHNGSNDWAAVTVNTPVVTGDHVSTGKDSRAEIQLDNANILRMADEATANIVTISRTQMQLEIGQGLVNYEVMKGSEADVEIQTPNVAIHPVAGEGSFRITVNSDGETIVDVRKGSAEISTPQGSTRVDRDQRITIHGNADDAQYQVSGAPGRDEWDRWNTDRDHTIESAQSWQHTNPYYTGTQDLDANGQWNTVPDYGSVWFPNEGPGWAPYRDGRWVYEPYYGWTWVSYEPWGWAPYHYGRWFVYGGNWGWWPGPVYVGYRPLWAPAYVSFLGFRGGGWGVSVGFGYGFGFGTVGWLPIGPGDRFFPWYGRGVGGVGVVGVFNARNTAGGFAPLRAGPNAFSNVDRAATDERVRGGVSSMQADQFGRGRVPAQQARVDEGSFRQASMLTGRNPVTPSRESFHASDRQVSAGAIPRAATTNQRFFGGNAGQGGVSGAERGQAGFSRGGAPAGPQTPQNSARPSMQGSFGQSSQPGWRTFNSPSRSSQPATNGGVSQNYSRGTSSGYGYSRPPLNMQQPVVTPRASYSAPRSAPATAPRSAPYNAPYNGGYRGGAPSGTPTSGSRGGSAPAHSSGSHGSSGHSHH